jgi:hypothetical protein
MEDIPNLMSPTPGPHHVKFAIAALGRFIRRLTRVA